jgi:CPA1 family monovalent cation:H+ antiporter
LERDRFLIGLDLPEIVQGIRSEGIQLKTAIGYGVLVTCVLIIARMISAYTALLATFIFRRSVMPRAGSRKRQLLIPMLLGWTGMRGVVSLAAALAIPVTLNNGQIFPHRNLILFITFIVILSPCSAGLPYLYHQPVQLFETISFNTNRQNSLRRK